MTDDELIAQITARGHEYADQQSDVRLRKFARHVRDRVHLGELMSLIPDVTLRERLMERIEPFLKR